MPVQSFLLLRHQQPYFHIRQTEAQKNGQGLPWHHDTSGARSSPILSPVLTLGKCILWVISCRRTGGPRPSCSSLHRNFSRCPAADTDETTCRNEEQTNGGILFPGNCGPCQSELAALKLCEDAQKDFIGKVLPIFASYTIRNNGKVPRLVGTRA